MLQPREEENLPLEMEQRQLERWEKNQAPGWSGSGGRARVKMAKTVSRGRVPLDGRGWGGEKIRCCLKVNGSLDGAP